MMADISLRRRVVLADWDNTLCQGFTLSTWAEFLVERRLFGTVSTIRNLIDTFSRGAFSYEEFCRRMAHAYADGLAGRTQKDVLAAGAAFIRSDKRRLFKFVRHLWAYFEKQRLSVVVLTGAPEEPLKHYADAVGFELGGALRLQIKDGFYTGEIVENCGLYEAKQAAARRVSFDNDVAMAFGDSVSDLPLLNAAPVGFVVLGATHNSIPSAPHLFAFESERDPRSIARFVKRHVAEVSNA